MDELLDMFDDTGFLLIWLILKKSAIYQFDDVLLHLALILVFVCFPIRTENLLTQSRLTLQVLGSLCPQLSIMCYEYPRLS